MYLCEFCKSTSQSNHCIYITLQHLCSPTNLIKLKAVNLLSFLLASQRYWKIADSIKPKQPADFKAIGLGLFTYLKVLCSMGLIIIRSRYNVYTFSLTHKFCQSHISCIGQTSINDWFVWLYMIDVNTTMKLIQSKLSNQCKFLIVFFIKKEGLFFIISFN